MDGEMMKGLQRRKLIDKTMLDLEEVGLCEDMTSNKRVWTHMIRVVD